MNWKRLLADIHNYLGFALSFLFVLWFFSGIVMMYYGHPVQTRAEHLAGKKPLQAESIGVSPAEAIEQIEVRVKPRTFRLDMVGDRPAYKFKDDQGLWQTVYADDGSRFEFSREFAGEMLSRYDFKARVRTWTRMEKRDQWTILGDNSVFYPHRPLHRAYLNNESGDLVYFSSRTGDIVRSASFSERFWAFLGPITHYFYYPTILRLHDNLWHHVVVWTSGIGTIVGILGIAIGLVFFRWDQFIRWLQSTFFQEDKTKNKPLVPYRGWLKWHTILGLLFGLLTVTWAFSGMLSLSPLNWHSYPESEVATNPLKAKRPIRLDENLERSPARAIKICNRDITTRELQILAVAERFYYHCIESPGQARLVPTAGPEKLIQRFDGQKLVEKIRSLTMKYPIASASVRSTYDHYHYAGVPGGYGEEESQDLANPYVRVKMDDPAQTWFYFDTDTGQLIQSVHYRDRWNRWLYNGLHSLDFPFLYRNPWLWWGAMWVLLLGGLAISVTGFWLTIRWLIGLTK